MHPGLIVGALTTRPRVQTERLRIKRKTQNTYIRPEYIFSKNYLKILKLFKYYLNILDKDIKIYLKRNIYFQKTYLKIFNDICVNMQELKI